MKTSCFVVAMVTIVLIYRILHLIILLIAPKKRVITAQEFIIKTKENKFLISFLVYLVRLLKNRK